MSDIALFLACLLFTTGITAVTFALTTRGRRT